MQPDGKKLKLSWVPLYEQRKKLTVAYIIRDVATDVLALYRLNVYARRKHVPTATRCVSVRHRANW